MKAELDHVEIVVSRFIDPKVGFLWLTDVELALPLRPYDLDDPGWLDYVMPPLAEQAVDERWISGVYEIEVNAIDTRDRKDQEILWQRLYFNYYTGRMSCA